MTEMYGNLSSVDPVKPFFPQSAEYKGAPGGVYLSKDRISAGRHAYLMHHIAAPGPILRSWAVLDYY